MLQVCPPTLRINTSYHQRKLPMMPVTCSLSHVPSAPPVQMGVTVDNVISRDFVVMRRYFRSYSIHIHQCTSLVYTIDTTLRRIQVNINIL